MLLHLIAQPEKIENLLATSVLIFWTFPEVLNLTFSIMTKQPYLAAKDDPADESPTITGSKTKCTKSFFFRNKDCQSK